jgi:hypothetical protein
MKNKVVIAIQDMSSWGSYMMATDLSPVINYFNAIGVVKDENFFGLPGQAPYAEIVSSVSSEPLFLYPINSAIYTEEGMMNWAYIGKDVREDMKRLLQLLDYEVIEPELFMAGTAVAEAVERMKPYLEE